MITWFHADSRGVLAIPQAIARATAKQWSADASPLSQGTRAADIRALVLATAWTVANLAGAVQITDASGRLLIDADKMPRDPERARAAGVLWRTWDILSEGGREGGRCDTTDGSPAVDMGTIGAGAFPVAAAIIAGAVVAAAAIAAYIARDAHVTATKLSLDAHHQEMVVTHAKVLDQVNQHIEDEARAGHPLPFPEARKVAIDALVRSQENAAKGTLPGFIDPLSKVAEGVGGGLKLGLIAAIAAGIFLVLGRK